MSICALGRPSTFYHVKGYQDDHHVYHELSLEARLNVDADLLACRFRKNDPSIRPLVPRVTSNPAASFRIWRRLLGRAFLLGRSPLVNSRRPHLIQPLGTWLPGSAWLQSNWTTFYNQGDNRLYWQDEMDTHLFCSHSFLHCSRAQPHV
jgi:hypothetical protein